MQVTISCHCEINIALYALKSSHRSIQIGVSKGLCFLCQKFMEFFTKETAIPVFVSQNQGKIHAGWMLPDNASDSMKEQMKELVKREINEIREGIIKRKRSDSFPAGELEPTEAVALSREFVPRHQAEWAEINMIYAAAYLICFFFWANPLWSARECTYMYTPKDASFPTIDSQIHILTWSDPVSRHFRALDQLPIVPSVMEGTLMSKNPAMGKWPVDPQTDIEISRARIWIDGCFDFSHHGMWLLELSSFSYSHQQLKGQSRSCRCNATSEETGQPIVRWSSFRRRYYGE